MAPIETATPEQVARCILALKAHIDRVEAENQRKDAEIERLREALGKTREKLEPPGCVCGAYETLIPLIDAELERTE